MIGAPRPADVAAALSRMLPGMVLVGAVTAAAYGLRQLPGLGMLSPMFSAILIGMAVANLTVLPRGTLPGVAFLGKKLLRFAVALLGLQLTLFQVYSTGAAGMAALVCVVALTYGFTLWAGRLLGVEAPLCRLLAAGTSICGASAIAAANAVEQARDEDVSYAIACITLFGTLAIAVYPLLGAALGLDGFAFGFWTGASVHEVAQVVATGFQMGDDAGEFAVVVKLSRVLLLAPLLLLLPFIIRGRRSAQDAPPGFQQVLPVFVIGFVVLMLANTLGLVPAPLRQVAVQLTPVMLAASLGALGLGTRLGALREKGARPLLLAGLATLFISGASLLVLPLLA